jgi:hypothetical protein
MGSGSSVEEEQKPELELELHWDGFVTKSISAPKVQYLLHVCILHDSGKRPD